MAAEKLTRGRFVQIIIMLTLLVTVFIWRTVTFTDQQIVECNLKPNCSFSVKNEQFNAQKIEDKVVLQKPSNNWIIEPRNSAIKIIENESNWEIYPESGTEFELSISDLEQSNLTGVKFRI
ncbi:hypothetical protein [Vibrio sp. TBV020]|uniref:hypothetical protein n=1 Tax=Vibrio sp. TBV020 TaxID=3137398 RepID=UPI0038CDB6C4